MDFGRDADDYTYQRRPAPTQPGQVDLDRIRAKDSRRRTQREKKALIVARHEEQALLEEQVRIAMGTYTSDRALARAVGVSAVTVKRVRQKIERDISERTASEQKAPLVALCTQAVNVFAKAAMAGDTAASREARAWADMLARLDGAYARPEADAAARVEIDVTVIEATVAQMVAQNEQETRALEAQIIQLPASHPAAG